MVWRVWSFGCGLPLGLLALLALVPEAAPGQAQLAALAGGVALLAAVWLLARIYDDDPHRGLHLAVAASLALAAAPAALAALLGLPLHLLGLTGSLLLFLAVWLRRGRRVRGPVQAALALPLSGLLWAAVGGLAVVALGGLSAAIGGEPVPPLGERTANAIYDMDARVETRPRPRCQTTPARVQVLLDRGAHPRFGPEDRERPGGRWVWFDAPGPEGRRQIHRVGVEREVVQCWTCGEPGNNRRPAPAPLGGAVLFDTDRFATWRHPTDTEIQILNSRTGEPQYPSRRLTYARGPDDHAVAIPGGGGVVWSRARNGRYAVVSASVRSGHGSLGLSRPSIVAAGGAGWVAPVAWSPDARALAIARGNPFAPLQLQLLDPATARSRPASDALVGAASVGFSGDGGRVVLASGRRGSVWGLLPDSLGFLLGPVAALRAPDGPRFLESHVEMGDTEATPTPVSLGEHADWGAPTGVDLAPDGRSLVLGQRQRGAAATEERLLLLELDCEV